MINIYVNDIRNALKNQCYFSALSLALTLPDICGMAEYPESPVVERYIGWYDRYIVEYHSQKNSSPESPYVSGEVVYNLRNTYLHQGSPNVIASKVRKETNQIDKFILVLGDGTQIQEMSFTLDVGMGKAVFRSILIDVTYLCNSICDCALWYYQNNVTRFSFDFNVLPQSHLYAQGSHLEGLTENEDPLGEAINHKLKASDSQVRMAEGLTEHIIRISAGALKEKGEKTVQGNFGQTGGSAEEKENTADRKKKNHKKKEEQKKEYQLRCFFGQNFKEKRMKENRETIIQIVLNSKTKTELNNQLMKFFPNEDVRLIYQRLKPVIKDLPGK